jgi:hypothetical protein
LLSFVVDNSCFDLFFKSTASMDPYEVLISYFKLGLLTLNTFTDFFYLS